MYKTLKNVFSVNPLVYNELKYIEAVSTLTEYNFSGVIKEIKEDPDYLAKGGVYIELIISIANIK